MTVAAPIRTMKPAAIGSMDQGVLTIAATRGPRDAARAPQAPQREDRRREDRRDDGVASWLAHQAFSLALFEFD